MATVKDAIVDFKSQIEAKKKEYDQLYSQSINAQGNESSELETTALSDKMNQCLDFIEQYKVYVSDLEKQPANKPCPSAYVPLLVNTPNTERTTAINTAADASTAANDSSTNELNKENDNVEQQVPYSPFDLRLNRMLSVKNTNFYLEDIPYSNKSTYSSIDGYIMSNETFNKNFSGEEKDSIKKALDERRKSYENDSIFQGTSAIMNPYAIVRLSGAEGSKYLLNQKNQRKFYEVDGNGQNILGYSLNPNTSSLITWGNDDPYQRTPYSFSDFIFCKYWNIVPNNRLITLRRYAAPILDNLSFPGMADSTTSKKTMFPPMASAVTFFGENTGNKLSSIMKFSSSYRWGEVKSDVWTVDGEQLDAGKVFESVGLGFGGSTDILAKSLSVMDGTFNIEAAMNNGNLAPDPFQDGSYENRILGPVNSIDSVKKRERGLDFDMSNLKIVFDYVSRPIGGVNGKAIMLDILANFLVMGTSSAVFFGGAHRFKIKPAISPFPDSAMKSLYKGEGINAMSNLIDTYAEKLSGTSLVDVGLALTNLLGSTAETLTKKFTGNSIGDAANSVAGSFNDKTKSLMSEKSIELSKNGEAAISAIVLGKIGIPYLKGMKALLTGDPVGDWHLTIGNPLNPIALIGNLICKNIEIECNDELGSDDFPTEWKITVTLDHGMARDKDAIESMFNKGGGRIYELPDNFKGSADRQSIVDKYTNQTEEQQMQNGPYSSNDTPTANQQNVPGGTTVYQIKPLAVAGDQSSIWNKTNFQSISTNLTNNFQVASINTRTLHGDVEWIAKTLK